MLAKKLRKIKTFIYWALEQQNNLRELVMNILKDQKGKENCGSRGKL